MSDDTCNVCVEPVELDADADTCSAPFVEPMIKILGAKIGGDNKGCSFNLSGPVFSGPKAGIKIDCEVGKIGGGNSRCGFLLTESQFTGESRDTRIRHISWQLFGGNKECTIAASGTKYGTDEDSQICHVGVGIGGKNSESDIDLKPTIICGPSTRSVYTLFTPSTGEEDALCTVYVGSVAVQDTMKECKITVVGGVLGGGHTLVPHAAVTTWQDDCKPPRTIWATSMTPKVPA